MSPFTIIRGGQAEQTPPATEFARFDRRRATIDQMKVRHIAERDKAILRERGLYR